MKLQLTYLLCLFCLYAEAQQIPAKSVRKTGNDFYTQKAETIRWSSSVTPSQKAVLEKLIKNMVRVECGSFQMGGDSGYEQTKPAHTVTLSQDYYIGKYEVTQAEWQAVKGSNPSKFKGDPLPVEYISWDDCQEFIRQLNVLTGLNFRLPTEAEWEYAARGGSKSKGYTYSGNNDINSIAWYGKNSGNATHPVGTRAANELGLYDMSGNVWEWCQDWYANYNNGAQTSPQGPSSGSYRTIRGGGWGDTDYCRVIFRTYASPGITSNGIGFRLVL